MKRIGISQRLEYINGRDEFRDALDTRWAELIWSQGYLPILLNSGISDVIPYLDALKLDGFILSGGNDIGSAINRDRLENEILNYSSNHKLPVLGICRGMQFMNHYLGGSLNDVEGHVACRHSIQGKWVEDKNQKIVNSFHNKAIFKDSLGENLEILATSNDNVIEAVKHHNLPWLGIMWHPEREIPFTLSDTQLLYELFGK